MIGVSHLPSIVYYSIFWHLRLPDVCY